jgi:hypothetical protein
MNKKETLTLRQYAKRCGTTHQTVSAAVKSGRIDKGYDRKSKRIIPDIANLEWGSAFIARHVDSSVPQEWLEGLSRIPVEAIELSPNDSVAEAERKKTIILAQRELLKLRAESGELVNREEQERAGFEFGKEIRITMQAIPDRIIDQLITLDRSAAHRLLLDSINEALTKLSEMEIKYDSNETR